MKLFSIFLLLMTGLTLLPANITAAEPAKLIFDTDIGNDIDDALALAVIHALQSRGECELLAVTSSKENPYSALYCDVVNTFYGRPGIPLGRVQQGKTPQDGSYVRKVVEYAPEGQPVFPRQHASADELPEAVSLLRKTLAAQPDHSVVLVVVGFSTNIARLLQSPADEISPLTGTELVAQKVKLLSQMIGRFEPGKPAAFHEYNVREDVPAARTLFELWPEKVPVVASGWEIGRAIQNRAVSILNDYNYVKYHPVKLGYEYWHKMPYDRPTYDLTSVLYAVRPERGYFGKSAAGRLRINQQGKLEHQQDSAGNHYFLTVTPEQVVRTQEVLESLSSQPPSH
ncbi:ribonucleoside hydrolase RihC [Gimesia panareensis]|uniref:Ribonucleoside hydrolase RihC n=1 Tax=Gimesia panareensis TaxID=2527978 RepID=A0A518FR29_9PLAN|nr:nucleoside hydrolase [Gimesia panareensis]QDV18804.1 ribonucleoside hydrolase RihC [Gimesia panareensis]